MRFDLTDEQKALRDALGAFLRDRLDGTKAVDATRTATLDRGFWADLGGFGIGGAMVPESLGGLGLDLLTLAIVAECAGAGATPAPLVPNALAAWIIAIAGTPQQRERWLGRLMAGDAIAAFAFQDTGGWLEPDWTLSGNRLTGTKRNVEWGAEADLLLVGAAGGALSIVLPGAGVEADPLETLDRSRPLVDIHLDEAESEPLPARHEQVRALLDAMLVTHAADAIGAAAAAHAMAVAYAMERRQFGRPIGAFQALKHQLADMSVELEPARPLVWYAAHAWDTGRPDAPRMAALAKAHAGEIAVSVGRAAIEAHGGIGYTWEYPAHLLLKRAMHDRAALGGTAFHRQRAAALAGWGACADG